MGRVPAAGADDATPTIAVVEDTSVPPVPTVAAEASPTVMTRIIQERTPVAAPTSAPIPRVAPIPTITAASSIAPVLPAAPYVPPPSPEQLRESARLRWGGHVPAA